MLTFYAAKSKGPVSVDISNGALPREINWIDACDPTDSDMSFLKKIMNVRIPTLSDLVEIESSSRLASEGETLIMSMPALIKDESGYPRSTPVGFVVNAERLATIRFDRLQAFEALAQRTCANGDLSEGGLGAAISLIEIVVDNMADLLERIGEKLDKISHSIFSDQAISMRRRPRRGNRLLIGLLQEIGRSGDVISKVSENLLGIGRMAPFLLNKGTALMEADSKSRLETVRDDAKSLHEFQDHLANKTQFLLDTLLGLTNIEQNNVFRVLTVVSVVGIPPTFFVSMWGMNFKNMPELQWSYGYVFALAIIALSAVIPAAWFKLKGWW